MGNNTTIYKITINCNFICILYRVIDFVLASCNFNPSFVETKHSRSFNVLCSRTLKLSRLFQAEMLIKREFAYLHFYFLALK